MTEEQRETYLRALIAEREGYKARGEDGNLAHIDAEIARVKGEATPPAKRAQTRVRKGQTRIA